MTTTFEPAGAEPSLQESGPEGSAQSGGETQQIYDREYLLDLYRRAKELQSHNLTDTQIDTSKRGVDNLYLKGKEFDSSAVVHRMVAQDGVETIYAIQIPGFDRGHNIGIQRQTQRLGDDGLNIDIEDAYATISNSGARDGYRKKPKGLLGIRKETEYMSPEETEQLISTAVKDIEGEISKRETRLSGEVSAQA